MADKYTMPFEVEIDGKIHKIRNNCDFRVVLDCIQASKDDELEPQERTFVALNIFYEDFESITNFEMAVKEMTAIINEGEEDVTDGKGENQVEIADFNIDFPVYISALNKNLGYDCRNPNTFTHWWTFLSAYKEIGECFFSNVVSIRNKRYNQHKPLDKADREFYAKNEKVINAIYKLNAEDEAFLNDLD